ncbi:MAG: thiamine phosphate synthase, partial [Hyphomicrobiales bacterium]
AALSSVPVAAVLIAPRDAGDASDTYQNDCKLLTPIAQKHGAAVLTMNDTQVSGRANADGIHLTSNLKELKEIASRFQPQRIVGAGAIHSKHDAMEMGEALPDYLFFGDPFESEGSNRDEAVELASWWADLFEVPCVAMGGTSENTLQETIATGIDFVGVRTFVWQHPEGPEAAIKAVHKLLSAR